MRRLSFLLLVSVVVAFTSCKKTETPTDDPNDVAYAAADAAKGGIMYDKFWATESGFDQNDANLAKFNDYSNFFRCKQCHGWDGLGNKGAYINRKPKTSRPNVTAFDMMEVRQNDAPIDIFNAIKGIGGDRRDISYDLSAYDPASNNVDGDMMPDFSQILTDAQIWDLVKFIKEGMFDVTELYDATYEGTYPTGSVTFSNLGLDGNAANGKTFYAANCAACHGADGTTLALEDDKTVGSFARTKANEAQHKVHYGQLGTAMTGQFDLSVSDMKDLYKALSSETDFPNNPANVADGALGGIMYDKFWAAESGFDQNDANLATFDNYSNFFRCKQCHGWDGLGRNGAYINRAPKTSRPNVSAVDMMEVQANDDLQEIFDAIKGEGFDRRDISYDLASYDPETNSADGDRMPYFGQILTDAQIWNLAKFIKDGLFDVSLLYDATYEGTYPTGTVTFANIGLDGDATAGDAYYAANCAQCHGADGMTLELEGGRHVGSFTRQKANEAQHKIHYGQLGSLMAGNFDITLTGMKDLYKALDDAANYPD